MTGGSPCRAAHDDSMSESTGIVGVDHLADTERDRSIDDLTYLLDESEDPGLLVLHAVHPHPWVRQAVAGNAATPQETVAVLAGDEAPVVRRNAALTCTDLAVLRVLSRDPDPATSRTARSTLRRLVRRRKPGADRS